MFKKSICVLLAFAMALCVLPIAALADDTGYSGQPPVVWGITDEDIAPFILRGTPWSVRSSLYPNNPPASVDTVEEKVDWIAEQCRAAGVTGEWETALWLHNWLIYNANYDYTFTYYYADGVLLQGTGVCNSYSLAYCLLLDEFGIENMKLDAPEMNHAWNLVKLDGQWCHVDSTWDDPGEGGYENFSYFGLDDELMGRDHVWNTSRYPACTSRANCYLIRTGANVATSKEEMMELLSGLAEARTEVIEVHYLGTDPNFSIIDIFHEWYSANKSKYGLWGYNGSYTDMMISMQMSYDPNWVKPDDTHTHVFSSWVTVGQALCTEPTTERRACKTCDYYETRTVAAKGHTEATVEGKDATCTEPGLTDGKVCVTCGATTVAQQTINAKGHSEVTVPGKAATCTESGLTDGKKCTVCGTTTVAQQTIKANGHKEVTVPGKEPTCTETGLTEGKKCNVCGTTTVAQQTIKANGHKNVTIPGKESTCTETGLTVGRMCTVCDTVTSAQITIAAKGHMETIDPAEAATCSKAGKTEGRHCLVCGTVTVAQTVIPATGEHRYSDDRDPTCNICGAQREDEVASVPMYRMYDPNSGEHFYSGSTEERDILIAAGWSYEGVGFNFPREGEPVFRLYDPIYGEHLYTMDVAEKDRLLEAGWNYEGVAFNSAPNTEVVQYRLHNPNAKRGAYHFTSSEEERALLLSFGWEDQGIGWYSCWE